MTSGGHERADGREERTMRQLRRFADPAARAEQRAFTGELLDRSAHAIPRSRATLRRDERAAASAARDQAAIDAEIRASEAATREHNR